MSANNTKKIVIPLIVVIILLSIFTIYYPFNPKAQTFLNEEEKLKRYIAVYQKAAEKPWAKLKPTKLLQVGIRDKDVISLRKRLQITGDLKNSFNTNNQVFDEQLKSALSHFQLRHGLPQHGKLDNATLEALNISPLIRLKQIQANLERWKILEQKHVDNYLWINIPEFQAKLVHRNKVTLSEKVIVGKPANQTPEMLTEITDIMLNPYWIVPPSIVDKAILPKTLQDPDFLKKHNIRVYAKNGKEFSLDELDKSELNPKDYLFRQEPGPLNPLGQIKYKITNSKSIFLHDTNSTALFEEANKALSHGCIRLQNPFKLFKKIIKADKIAHSEQDVQNILKSGDPYNIKLKTPLPVYITYITAWIDEKGALNFRDDIYNKDNG